MKIGKLLFLLFFLISAVHTIANTPEPPAVVKGRVLDETGQPLVGATVYIKGTNIGCTTNNEGHFLLKRVPGRNIDVVVSYLGYITQEQKADLTRRREATITFNLQVESNLLSQVEVFGERHEQPVKLDAITRMPLRPSEQIQSISVISNKMIEEQGAMTVTDAVRNVPGVTLFGSYGGVRESLSTRGYRGVPILKNGVRVDSDFRTGSALSEMSGIESVQVIKGSAAITQGIGNDLGSAGGVINVVTKTPKFVNAGEVSLRGGSWGEVRPAFDVQTVLDKNQTVAFRMNGVYRRSDNYRPVVKSERLYVNPSLEWRPDEKTTVTLEMDYLDDNSTPFTSTVNLSADTEENLYDMPHSKFLGTRNDNVNTRTLTYAARLTRALGNNLSLRAAYFAARNQTDNTNTSLSTVKNEPYNIRQRSISRSTRDDKNTTFQLDLIGRDIYTGPIKHTFQLGFDYKTTDLTTQSFTNASGKGGVVVDVIDVFADKIANPELENVGFTAQDAVHSETSNYGIMAQEVMTINQYLKAVLGLRYSSISTPSEQTEAGRTRGDAWNPMVGVMVTPIRNINLFGSYTTTTSLRSAANMKSPEQGGGTIGPSKTKQWEVGIKSDWLNDRLRFNFTYFDIITENLSYTEYYEGTATATGFYGLAGDLKRKGIETELSGRILENLQVILGYAYLKAEYKNSPAYQNGSAPMNAPKHTANGWVYYTLNRGALKGLSAGVGAYYVGKRPVNDWTLKPDGHGSMTGAQPFDMPGYTTVNLQLAYAIGPVTARVYFNNLFDEIGYNAYYRGGFINQIDPRNFAAVVSYRF